MKKGKFESGAAKETTTAQKKSAGFTKNALLYLHDLSYLLVMVLFVLLLCLRVVVVSGNSMKNTLISGDYLLLLSNTFYRTPQSGDIIVASKESFDDGEPIIKRVIATEGQTVDIDFHTGAVYVDGNVLQESYISSETTLDEGTVFPLVVEEGCVFVMGDNRGRSQDSRSTEIGLIDTREILGKAIFLFFPGEDETSPRDFGRIGAVN